MRIAVAGHRVLAEHARVVAGVEAALARIERTFPGQSMTVISSLAEGADRIIADCVLRRAGSRLIVPLPFTRDEYERDFDSPSSREEFVALISRADEVLTIPPQPTRAAAFAAAADLSLENADVLVAVWDGLPAQGSVGTSRTVARAQELNLPIAWVHAGNRRPGSMEPVSLGDEQGEVTFERM